MQFNSQQREVIKRSQASAIWWMRNFVRVKHPGAGIIRYDPWDYQQNAVKCFRTHRNNIFRKPRQAGISKVCGIFGLWYAMFAPHKTVLVVSRTDLDAMKFLHENVRIPFQNLPRWMQEAWLPKGNKDNKDNEHEMWFANGSKISSLTSNIDVLRSNASSLNILDEVAFIQGMDAMWAGGQPTLIHGGSVIVASTPNGVGGWYWSTCVDAEAKLNNFNLIDVRWWDMKWRLEYDDILSGQHTVIAPTEGITECKPGKFVDHPTYGRTELDPQKYGPYWSPWLEEEWRALQARGETWKFDQEILAEFIGSGNTVLPKSVLVHIGTTVQDDYQKITGHQTYVHPVTGVAEDLDFSCDGTDEGFFIWKSPVGAIPARFINGKMVEAGRTPHCYVMGVDIATGKGRDAHAIEVFDIDEREQVAELVIRCLPAIFKKMVDRIGRWYNCALAVVERNNGGDDLIDDLQREMTYPRLWRRTQLNDKPTRKARKQPLSYDHYGHFTSLASKPVLNKYLLDYIRDKPDEGFRIYSRRLLKQLHIYVRKKDRAGRDTGKTEAETGPGNYDDLVMAAALGLLGAPDAIQLDATGMVPLKAGAIEWVSGNQDEALRRQQEILQKGDPGLLAPAVIAPPSTVDESALAEMMKFAREIQTIVPVPTAVVHRRRNVLS